MARTRIFVLLHGGDGWFKQVYGGGKSGRAEEVRRAYLRAGWQGQVYTIRAATLREAVDKIGKKLYG